jgi:hypothetical protein
MTNQFYSVNNCRTRNQPLISINRVSWLRQEIRILRNDDDLEFMQKYEYCCAYCEFKSKTNKIVLFNDKSKHIICSLCLAPLSLSHILLNHLGELAVLPELTQTEINNLFRWFFVIDFAADLIDDKKSWVYQKSPSFQNKVKDIATLRGIENRFRTILLDRGEVQLRKIFNAPISSKWFYPLALSKINSEIYNNRQTHFSAIKLIPKREVMNNTELTDILNTINFSLNDMSEFYSKLGKI